MNAISSLFSPEMLDNPYGIYAELRENAPVLRLEAMNCWVLSRYDDVQYVLKTPELFSSVQRTELVMKQVKNKRLYQEMVEFWGPTLLGSDPPTHTRLRRLIGTAFTPKAIARLEARIRDLARDLVDNILRREEFDLMEELAIPLPLIVIAEMLGVDTARRADFKRWSDDLILGSKIDTEFEGAEVERMVQSRRDFSDYFRTIIEARRREPREDLISDLVRAETIEGKLTSQEVLTMALVLLVAGNETTTNLIGNATAELLNHPEDLGRLREDPSLIPGFVEEALRYCSPVAMLNRRATEDVTIRGVTIPKDEGVALLIEAANRDPAQFADPERFDITRQQPAHLTFGCGIHFCVGAPLTRLETKIAFEEMLLRLPAFSRKSRRIDWNNTWPLRGQKTLWLEWGRREAA